MPNADENVSFKQGSDTGQSDAPSIQPIQAGEKVWIDTDNRPLENLRRRTEILRREAEDQRYLSDYDRALLLRSDAVFTLTQPVFGQYALTMTGGTLNVHPALSPRDSTGPGRPTGGRIFVTIPGAFLPFSGTLLVNDLTLTADYTVTGQRGYSDTDDFAVADTFSIGANRITVDLIADPTLVQNVVTFGITQTPKTKITIRHGTNGGATSLNTLIAAINADLTSQGSYGVANYLRASTTSPGTMAPTDFTNGVLQGSYDSEVHTVTPAQVVLFFSTPDNYLREGEGLAIGYPKGLVEPAVPPGVPPYGRGGGRRQSTTHYPVDRIGGAVSNTTPLVGTNLFNTAREPEKIPYAIPLGMLVGGCFVFIDGTKLAVGGSVSLGGASTVLASLGSTTFGSSGSSLVGYDGSGLWNNDSGAPTSIPAGTVNDALDAIVADLAAETATASGARRVGSEGYASTHSAGNLKLDIPAGSVRKAIETLLNAPASATQAGGVAYRVSERGHQMHAYGAIQKDFGEVSPVDISAGGARLIGAQLAAPPSPAYSAGLDRATATAFELLEPLGFDFGGNDVLNIPETIVGVDAFPNTMRLLLASYTIARATALAAGLQTAMHNLDGGTITRMLYARITGAGAYDGLYIFGGFETGTPSVVLLALDGTPPDFTGITGGSLTILQGITLGSDEVGHRMKLFHYGDSLVPVIDVAFAASPAGGSLLLRVIDDNTYPLASCELRSNLAIWTKGGVERHTDNILAAGDKVLLDGVETASPVDATANHHHGVPYTQWNPIPHVDVVWGTSGTAIATFTDLTDANGETFQGPTVAGQSVKAYQLELTIRHAFTDADAAGTISSFVLGASPGVVYDATPSIQTTIESARNYKPVAGAAYFDKTVHVIVNCDATRNISMKVAFDSQVKLTTSLVTARIVAAITAHT